MAEKKNNFWFLNFARQALATLANIFYNLFSPQTTIRPINNKTINFFYIIFMAYCFYTTAFIQTAFLPNRKYIYI